MARNHIVRQAKIIDAYATWLVPTGLGVWSVNPTDHSTGGGFTSKNSDPTPEQVLQIKAQDVSALSAIQAEVVACKLALGAAWHKELTTITAYTNCCALESKIT
ncbi:OLC1v1010312C1 [Oldenlandia corymbosa var. corymbosa]|uniref:OLC1v1010312C1 n=1 Tax=Oldenlandia corymbosa var. corymbosa TaxID=529605 RepID=A0AAV1DR10_OLDCO|nr:OLC1v1010312C1 [Oldenlandia corymbosa var. corymbosa]